MTSKKLRQHTKHILLTMAIVSTTISGICGFPDGKISLSSTHQPTRVFAPPSKLGFTLDLLPLIDIYSGASYRIGAEIPLYRNTTSHIQLGGYFPNFNGLKNVKGHTAKLEVKYYIRQRHSLRYVSIEYFLKNQSYDWSDSITLQPAYRKTNHLSKIIQAGTVRYGIKKSITRQLYFDISGGLGVRHKNVSCSISAEESKNRYTGDSQLLVLSNECGKFYRPNIDFSIKIGLTNI